MPESNLFFNVILEMIKRIEDSTKKFSQAEFLKDDEIQDATLMRLQVIGENIKNIPLEIKKKNKSINWRKFEKLRNLISHRYDSVDYTIVWNFITKNIPELKKEFENLKG